MSTWDEQTKSTIATEAFVLNIDGTYDLLVESTYKLQIQETSAGWDNQTKN